MSNMRIKKMKTGIVPINDGRVLLIYDTAESFA